MVADHYPPLELVHAHGEVAALDGDGGATVDGSAERLDEIYPGLGTDVTLTHRAVLGVVAAVPAPDTAEVSGPGHAQRAVRVTFVAADQPALVQGDVGPVDDVVPIPDDGDGGVVLADSGLVSECCSVTHHRAGL